jgi:small subunit ribosomal protein S16
LLVIRLQRTGRHNLAAYRVVVAEKSKAVKKQVVEVIGHYLPTQTPKVIEINLEKVQTWIGKGAQPSATVASLLKQLGAADMDQYIGKPAKSAKKKKATDEPEVPAEAVATEAPTETPATEEVAA